MKDTHDLWSLLAAEGLHVRPVPADPQRWEYTLPLLDPAWHGPYTTREAALTAALRQLLSLALTGTSLLRAAQAASSATLQPPADPATQVKPLRQELRELEKVRALRGIMNASDLEPRIAYLREQIVQLEKRMAQSGEG